MSEHTTEPNKYIWYHEENGVRRLTGYCCCDLCWTECDLPRPQALEAHTNIPEGATYKYNGAVGTAQETAEKVFQDWGETTSTDLKYWLEMTCALRPGDSYAADEMWADQALVTRLT